MEDVTIIIKAFLRQNCVIRLLKSILKFAPKCPIIIFDDGNDANQNKKQIIDMFANILNIKYIVSEEENVGLSKGRNVLVDNVQTKYFVLCDDDFIFFKQTNIILAKRLLEQSNYDILGGLCLHAYRINYGTRFQNIELFFRKLQKLFYHYRKVGYKGRIDINGEEVEIVIDKLDYARKEIYNTDICENFFIAKTKVVRNIRWTDKLKMNEHEDFFIKAKKANVKIGVTSLFKVYHFPETNRKFKSIRDKTYFYDVLYNNNLKRLKVYRNNVGIIQEYKIGKQNSTSQQYTNNLLGKSKKLYYKLTRRKNEKK